MSSCASQEVAAQYLQDSRLKNIPLRDKLEAAERKKVQFSFLSLVTSSSSFSSQNLHSVQPTRLYFSDIIRNLAKTFYLTWLQPLCVLSSDFALPNVTGGWLP
jgi:hypothetical protein